MRLALALATNTLPGISSGGGGGGVSGLPVDMLITFEAGTAGNITTVGNLEASQVGYAGGEWTAIGGVGFAGLTHTYISSTNDERDPLLVDGSETTGAGTRGLVFEHGEDADWEGLKWTPPGGLASGSVAVSAMVRFNGEFGVGDSNVDHFHLQCNGFCVLQHSLNSNGVTNIVYAHGQTEGGPSSTGPGIPVEPDTLYLITLRANADEQLAEIAIIDADTGSLVGVSSSESVVSGFDYFLTQDYLTHYGGDTTVDNIALDWTNAAFPAVQGFTTPATTGLTVEQTAVDRLEVTWDARKALTYKLEREVDGGGWTELEAAIADPFTATYTYEDTDVSDGEEVQYRVTPRIHEHIGPATTSDVVEVDNGLFPTGAWYDTTTLGATNDDNQVSAAFTLLAKLVLPVGGSCTKLRLWNSSGTPVSGLKMALYDDSSARNLLGSGSVASGVTGPDWTEVTLTVPVDGLTVSQTVWIGLHAETDNDFTARYNNAAGAPNVSYKTESYATFPTATFTEEGTLNWNFLVGAFIA